MTSRIHLSPRAALTAAFLALAGCSETPDQERIREAIAAMAQAVEQKDPAAFLAHVSDEYLDDGGRDRTAIRRMMLYHFLRNENISVYVTKTGIEVDGDRATVRINAGVTGSATWIPERGQHYRIVSGWREENGKWRVLTASWEPTLFGE